MVYQFFPGGIGGGCPHGAKQNLRGVSEKIPMRCPRVTVQSDVRRDCCRDLLRVRISKILLLRQCGWVQLSALRFATKVKSWGNTMASAWMSMRKHLTASIACAATQLSLTAAFLELQRFARWTCEKIARVRLHNPNEYIFMQSPGCLCSNHASRSAETLAVR